MRARFWLFIWLLQVPIGLLCAAEKPLVGQIPSVVASGKIAPLSRVAGTNELRLALCLPVRDPAGLANLLASIYTPGSPQFHRYLTPDEFTRQFGPTPDDYEAIVQFARTNRMTVIGAHRNRLVLDVKSRVADVENAFRVKLHWYQHPSELRRFFAPDTLPKVEAHLPLLQVSGLDDFNQRHPNLILTPGRGPARQSPSGGSSPLGTYMGNDFRQAYFPGTTLTGAGQRVGLVEFDGFRPDDIASYEAAIGLTNDLPRVTVVPVDGGVGSTGADIGEVTLDIEMVLAMSPGVSDIFVYEATNATPWVDMMSQIANDDLAAQVSCSWSGGGPDLATEQIFQQMAAQGQSFFNASGDGGAYTNGYPFPCASANITQVGGTYLDTDTNGNYAAESVWNGGSGVAGGGGVGLGVELPVWQMGVDMTTNCGSSFWRNVPDVALTAGEIYVIVDSQANTASGTSCAAPLWAGVAALINQQAAQRGQPPVGFLNPAIYALSRGIDYGDIFHDITVGNNTNLVSETNYSATPGFDLCTGWGTPAGTNLINALTVPQALGILPQTNFVARGLAGGPFSATNWIITLTNSGAGKLPWSVGGAWPAWLWVSASNGILNAHASTRVAVKMINASELPTGNYGGVLMFTNQASSCVYNAFVRLEIGLNIANNLVQNGGFETGDFSDWTLAGDTVTSTSIGNLVATDDDFPGLAHSGTFGAYLGEPGYPAALSQVLATTPGQPYLVSFWLDSLVAGNYQEFSVVWNGADLTNLVDPPAFGWSNFLFAVPATDINSTLEFDVQNEVSYFGLDDVSVTPLPPVTFSGCLISTNGFQLVWPSLAGLTYTIQSTTNLTSGDWNDLDTILAVTNESSFVDTNYSESSPQEFYQLMVQ